MHLPSLYVDRKDVIAREVRDDLCQVLRVDLAGVSKVEGQGFQTFGLSCSGCFQFVVESMPALTTRFGHFDLQRAFRSATF